MGSARAGRQNITHSTSSAPPIRVTRAQPGDLSQVIAILEEAATWLLARGVRQWEVPVPDSFRDLLARQVESGDVMLAWLPEAGPPIATMRFEWTESEAWLDSPADAGYVYSIGVRPAYTGRRIGEAMVAWAEHHVASRRKPRIRLDCWAGNERLRRYYEALGYVDRGVRPEAYYEVRRFEKMLTPPATEAPE
jgi:ribosomal protein S18 acetylase RimI-like enzyme